MKKFNFIVDTDNFRLVRDEIGVGKIKELSNKDVSLLAPHIEGHPDTIYVASSGVNLADDFGIFTSDQLQVAVEWVRHETKPQSDEPECNTYRYVFGLTSDFKCIGIDVTKKPETGQIAKHWTTFDDAVQRHFPESQDH